ncbi:hypothetical protein VV01_11945 [Luteipulveratus halotolerans]|uniref:Uncharacterized protein n=1 Tax=Luteipulveratus halotolerans TaxID=1631356 RepID=A0A0L6CJJ8_9MICO|nr:hypothetical protein VV01_11945 [Luteipulveratus halotolerans]
MCTVALVVAAGMTACGEQQVERGTPTSPSSSARPSVTTPAAAPTGVTPEGLQVRLELPRTTVRACKTLTGAVVVINPTGRAVDLWSGTVPGGPDCTPKHAVQLVGHGIDTSPAFTADCGSQPLRIASGTTRVPMSALTTYTSCSQDHPSIDSPRCGADGGPPGLPTGRYEARVVGSVLSAAPAVAVTVTS